MLAIAFAISTPYFPVKVAGKWFIARGSLTGPIEPEVETEPARDRRSARLALLLAAGGTVRLRALTETQLPKIEPRSPRKHTKGPAKIAPHAT